MSAELSGRFEHASHRLCSILKVVGSVPKIVQASWELCFRCHPVARHFRAVFAGGCHQRAKAEKGFLVQMLSFRCEPLNSVADINTGKNLPSVLRRSREANHGYTPSKTRPCERSLKDRENQALASLTLNGLSFGERLLSAPFREIGHQHSDGNSGQRAKGLKPGGQSRMGLDPAQQARCLCDCPDSHIDRHRLSPDLFPDGSFTRCGVQPDLQRVVVVGMTGPGQHSWVAASRMRSLSVYRFFFIVSLCVGGTLTLSPTFRVMRTGLGA